MARAGVRVEGLRELRKELRALEGDGSWKAELREAGKAAAEVVASEARRTAAQGMTTLAGTPATMGGRAVASIRALAGQTRATVAGGKTSIPYYAGWEFGSAGHFRQFPPKAGSSHNLYPAIERKRGEVIRVYGDHIDALTRKHFPG